MDPAQQLLAQPDGRESLWQRAPAWRTLTVAASFLTLAAVAMPLLDPGGEEIVLAAVEVTPAVGLPPLPPPAQARPPARPASHASVVRPAPPPADATSCGLNAPSTPRAMGGATIVGFFTAEQSQATFRNRAGMRGGEPSPTYLGNLWVRIHPDGAAPGVVRGTVLPAGMQVAIGDHVRFDGAYRDPSLPCHFVPSLITRNDGPVARPVVTGVGVEEIR
jgi:hypothetical protein